ncbi:MAG: glycosyltransferase family 39 protein [Solirubrobacteraceae bacterium]
MSVSNASARPTADDTARADRSRWSVDTRWMVWLFGVAFVLRLIFVLAVQRDQFPTSDPAFYHGIATNLANGDGFSSISGAPTAQWPPVYPFVLSLVYRVFGNDPQYGELFNVLVGAVTVPLLFFVARRALGQREARFAGVFFAVMPGQIFFTDVLLSETLFTFTLVGIVALAVVLRPSARTALVMGLAIGIAALSRGEGPLLLVLPLAMWWNLLDRRTLAKYAAILVGAMVLVVVPWTIRNASVMGSFIPVSTNAGDTFYSGHNPRANGAATYATPQVLAPVQKYSGAKREVEQSKLLRKEAISWALHHPLDELGLIPARFLSLNQGDGLAIGVWVVPGPLNPPISKPVRNSLDVLADFAYYSLLTLFIGSLLVFGRRLLGNAVLRGALIYIGVLVFLYSIVLYGNFRYRVPLEALMLLVAAPLAVKIWELRDRVRVAARAG